MESSGSAMPSRRATRGRRRSSSATVSPRHSTTTASPGGERPVREGVPWHQDPGVEEQSAVAVLRQAGERPGTGDVDAARRERLDERPGEPLKELVQGEEPVGGSRPANPGMEPHVAEGSTDDCAQRHQHGAKEFAGAHPSLGRTGANVVVEVAESPPGRPAPFAMTIEFRSRGDRASEGAKASDPAGDAVEGVAVAQLERALECGPVHAPEGARIRPEGLVRVVRKGSPAVEIEGRDREALAASDLRPGALVAVSPGAPRARVEEHADDGELDGASSAFRLRKARVHGNGVPAAASVRAFEMAPAAVQWNAEIRKAFARDLRNEVRRVIKPGFVDREMFERPVQAELEQLVSAFPNRLDGPEVAQGRVFDDTHSPLASGMGNRHGRAPARGGPPANRRLRAAARQAKVAVARAFRRIALDDGLPGRLRRTRAGLRIPAPPRGALDFA